jgi:large subunit ribosomal protein L10
MSRAIKDLVERELKKEYAELDSVLVVGVHGLNGTDANKLRGELRKKGIQVHVIKNRAAKRVLAGTVLAPIGSILTGPCAFVSGGQSPVDTAKELLRLAKEYPAFQLRSGLIGGEAEILSIEAISKLRSKADLQGDIVMLAVSPARRIAGCLNTGGKIAGCLKAMIAKLEKGETISKVA